MDSDNLQDGTEGDNHSCDPVHTSVSTELQKRPAGNNWEEDHHHSKSTRFDYATIAPQEMAPAPEEQASTFASQHNLLNVVNSFFAWGLGGSWGFCSFVQPRQRANTSV
ncbi:hypothetical protein JVT61DRAFT_6732 [Boletus reticuloceps]|uniref:Uncharacterized protein n=1 Tax=Boletus reticuloceps TaxID=495285 RepID=A0A8I2YIX4_9AGAM|nr:hypothetical protein JVT61DRAFT_6732 [Boletus reticuloceps]